MKKRLMIDLLRYHKKIMELIDNENIDYNFVNILYYVKEKYDVSVISLSTIFNVTRQTIYNYFQMKSTDLPKNIIDKVVEVYGELNLEKVLEKECLVEYENLHILPLIYENGMYDETFVFDISGQSYISKISEVFKPIFYSNNDAKGYVGIKQKYNFTNIWKNAVKETNELSYANDIDNRILNLLNYLKKTHSKEYLYLLLKIIQDRVDKDDDDFFIYISKYIKGGKDERS